ncbi:DsrE/DsrF/TusD sulfur relay family protein [Kaarinaea lacus]
MKILIILNDAPYGNERSYNGLRLAQSLIKNNPDVELTVFLMADAVSCAKTSQKPPSGYYNIELMLKAVLRGGRILLCGTCLDARGLNESELIEGSLRSDMVTLSSETVRSDRVLIF